MPSTSRNPSPNRNRNANRVHKKKPYDQGRYWILTIKRSDWSPPETLPGEIAWLRGQCEIGNGITQYEHWQLYVAFRKPIRLGGVKRFFTNSTHGELTRSDAAEAYVFKEDTSIAGTRFELGAKVLLFVYLILIVGL